MALIYNKWNDIMTKAFTNQNDWMSQLYHQPVHLLEYFFTCVLNLDKRLPYKEKARESVQYTF